MAHDPDDRFSDAERAGLDAWETPPLPEGFVEAAVDRAVAAVAPARPRRWAPRVAGAFGLVAAAVLVAVLALPGPGPERRHITIAGTVLSCDDCELGVAPMEDEMKATTAGLAGAAAGAALTAAVLVSVYDGRVTAVAPTGERVAAGPGDQIVVRPDRAPEVRRGGVTPSTAGEPSAAAPGAPGGGAGPGDAAGGRTEGGATAPAELVSCREEAETARARADRLAGRVEELEGRMRALKKEADRTRTFDLSQEQLLEMAEHCELRWDMQPLTLDEPQTVVKDVAEELGLDGTEIAEVNAVFAATNTRLLDALMGLYVEATGDSAPAGIAPDAMFAEIVDKTSRDAVKRVFQRLSAERAGLADPPADVAGTEPIERLFRLVTAAGDQLEREVADKIGPERAHALRAAHHGWGAKSASRMGCPGDGD